MKKFAALVLILAMGCASSSVTRVGSEPLAATAPTSEISVFSQESEVKTPFKILGIINYNNPGKFQILTLEDAMPNLKDQARSIGANAIIIDKSAPVKSGYISTGITVTARAIKVEK